jgi:hypothetical protein
MQPGVLVYSPASPFKHINGASEIQAGPIGAARSMHVRRGHQAVSRVDAIQLVNLITSISSHSPHSHPRLGELAAAAAAAGSLCRCELERKRLVQCLLG